MQTGEKSMWKTLINQIASNTRKTIEELGVMDIILTHSDTCRCRYDCIFKLSPRELDYPGMSGPLHDELSKYILNVIVLISIVIQTFPHILLSKSSDQSEIIQIISYLIEDMLIITLCNRVYSVVENL